MKMKDIQTLNNLIANKTESFDELIVKATSEDINDGMGWIMTVLDRIGTVETNPNHGTDVEECVKSITKRIKNSLNDNVLIKCFDLLNECITSGCRFRLELSLSIQFQYEIYKLLNQSNENVKKKLRLMIIQWYRRDIPKYDDDINCFAYRLYNEQIIRNKPIDLQNYLPPEDHINIIGESERKDRLSKQIELSLKVNAKNRENIETGLRRSERIKLNGQYKTLGCSFTDSNERMCIKCRVRPKCCRFSPCGHVITCNACGEFLRKCPLCKVNANGDDNYDIMNIKSRNFLNLEK